MRDVALEELDVMQRAALHAASEAMECAYDPYSRFMVGAALVGHARPINKHLRIVTGANVANASYGNTICAERAAIAAANAKGWRIFDVLAVIARHEGFDTTEVTAPCGICRQMLFELSQIGDADLEIVLSTTKKDRVVLTSIRELLPLPFGPKDLKIDLSKYRT